MIRRGRWINRKLVDDHSQVFLSREMRSMSGSKSIWQMSHCTIFFLDQNNTHVRVYTWWSRAGEPKILHKSQDTITLNSNLILKDTGFLSMVIPQKRNCWDFKLHVTFSITIATREFCSKVLTQFKMNQVNSCCFFSYSYLPGWCLHMTHRVGSFTKPRMGSWQCGWRLCRYGRNFFFFPSLKAGCFGVKVSLWNRGK